jgi:hypothetical protein
MQRSNDNSDVPAPTAWPCALWLRNVVDHASRLYVETPKACRGGTAFHSVEKHEASGRWLSTSRSIPSCRCRPRPGTPRLGVQLHGDPPPRQHPQPCHPQLHQDPWPVLAAPCAMFSRRSKTMVAAACPLKS